MITLQGSPAIVVARAGSLAVLWASDITAGAQAALKLRMPGSPGRMASMAHRASCRQGVRHPADSLALLDHVPCSMP